MEAKNGEPEKKPAGEIIVHISGTESTSNTPDRSDDYLSRSKFSKSNSRVIEPSFPTAAELTALTNAKLNAENKPPRSTPTEKATVPAAAADADEESDEEVYRNAGLQLHQTRKKKSKLLLWFEWTVLLCLVVVLVASLTIHKLRHFDRLGLQLWKWTVMALVILSGRLITKWFVNLLVFLIGKSFLVNKKFLYFVYGTKTGVQVFIWFGLVLLAWELLIITHDANRTKKTKRVLDRVTRVIACFVGGAALWLVKAFLIKLLASSFLGSRFFDRIQESLFHQFVVKVLSGPPMMDKDGNIPSRFTEVKFRKVEDAEMKEGVVDVAKVSKIRPERVSSWTMTGLVDAINGSEFSFPDPSEEDAGDKKDTEIKSEWGARAAAYNLFKNVTKPGYKYFEREDLLLFLKKEDVDNVFPLFEGAESGKIKRKALKNWLVQVYLSRKSLAHSLNDTKTAIEELNRVASGLVIIVSAIIGLLVMRLLTTQVLLFIGSQLLLVAFMFGSTAKNAFEAIIFVFVMHPYDVGDRCVIDGVQMVVEEMNILTTIFLRYDNQKIYYPNSVLSTKPIGNFYRSPEMGDSVEFAINFSTSLESIGALKARIKEYLESTPKFWASKHTFLIKEFEDVNKLKMALYFWHTINFQNIVERNNRRSELVLKLKTMFEELEISYQLLPQRVHMSYVQ